ncbi:MAG: aldose 1-epimerase family protein [Anaerocolumna sp.]
MATYSLQNDLLSIVLNEAGGELTSIIKNQDNTQYLWNADPNYWMRHSPILFPIVGSLKNQTFSFNDQTYSLPQHGFARDMNFVVEEKTDSTILFSLSATDETKKVYPFSFKLLNRYTLTGNQIRVDWEVINTDDQTIYFSIGGHPAFYCPLKEDEKQSDYFIAFDTKVPLHYIIANEQSLAITKPKNEQTVLQTENGIYSITPDFFDQDALIIEDHQCHMVSLLDPSKKPYVSVSFDAPLFGLWSPARKNAPFICIEPWYGRCDSVNFTGDFNDRDYINELAIGSTFKAFYTITIH